MQISFFRKYSHYIIYIYSVYTIQGVIEKSILRKIVITSKPKMMGNETKNNHQMILQLEACIPCKL